MSLRLNSTRPAIGVDVGGTKIEAALVDPAGHILAHHRAPTAAADGPTAVLHNIATAVHALLDRAETAIDGVGIGLPGQVDPHTGIVHHAANLGWRDVPVRADLQARLPAGLRLHIQRDSSAELLGEHFFGAGRQADNLVYLGLGTGLGAAALVDGRLVTGHTFTASEIGHLVLDPDGRPWHGDLVGTAESVVSGAGVVAEARALLAGDHPPTTLPRAERITAAYLLHAARQDDPVATAVMQKATDWLTRIVAIYAIVLNPQRIVIGGGFGKAAFDLMVPAVRRNLGNWALAESHGRLEIVRSTVVSSAIGAACLPRQHKKISPSFVNGVDKQTISPHSQEVVP